MQHITVEQLHRALITALTPQEEWLGWQAKRVNGGSNQLVLHLLF